jgi:hypothetical protein
MVSDVTSSKKFNELQLSAGDRTLQGKVELTSLNSLLCVPNWLKPNVEFEILFVFCVDGERISLTVRINAENLMNSSALNIRSNARGL